MQACLVSQLFEKSICVLGAEDVRLPAGLSNRITHMFRAPVALAPLSL